MKLKNIALTISLALISGGALAHGYVEKPESRAYMCKLNKQTNCGSAQWEPQSIEQKKGFPSKANPPDGQLASAGLAGFAPLDRQSVSEWLKTDIKPGRNEFTWHHTAAHATTKWQYFMTKQDWDVNKPLTRDSFEAKPFCEIDGKGSVPETRVTHVCDVPQRTGYQIIYAVWEIDNTDNSFYQVIDVNFPSDNNGGETGQETEWSKQLNGAIYGKDLNKGDKVIARFIDNHGQEVNAMKTTLEISSAEQGAMQRWSHDLAEKLNANHSDIRVGVKDQSGEINPAYGTNNVYVRTSSNLQSVVISYELSQPEIKESITLSDAQASDIVEGKSEVSLKADVTGDVTLEATVSDHAGANKGFLKETFSTGEYPLTIALNNVQAGHHILRYVATNQAGQIVAQDVQNLQLQSASGGNTGDYDFTFPDKLKSYKAGTVVLQPKDGHTYECKPFPYSGYCQQWAASANHYEPGVGSHWQDAWILKN